MRRRGRYECKARGSGQRRRGREEPRAATQMTAGARPTRQCSTATTATTTSSVLLCQPDLPIASGRSDAISRSQAFLSRTRDAADSY